MSKTKSVKSARANFLKNLTDSGYGDKDLVASALSKLDYEELDALAYACYRTAEKRGEDYFSLNLVSEDEED